MSIYTNSYNIRKAFIFNKNKEIKYQVGVGRALLCQFGSIHLIKMIIYTQYVLIAYCFIMYYNTEVQIIAISSIHSSINII